MAAAAEAAPGLPSRALYGMRYVPPRATATAGPSGGGVHMPDDPLKRSADDAAITQRVGGAKASLHPKHSAMFWLVAALGGALVLNGVANRR